MLLVLSVLTACSGRVAAASKITSGDFEESWDFLQSELDAVEAVLC